MVIFELELIVGQIKAWLTSFLAFEAWTSRLAFKKGGKGFSQVEKGLIGSILRHFPRPGELFTSDLIELFFELQGSRFLVCFILPIPLCQRPIPHEACGTYGFGKIRGLLRCGMKSDLMGTNHTVLLFPLPHIFSIIELMFLSVKQPKKRGVSPMIDPFFTLFRKQLHSLFWDVVQQNNAYQLTNCMEWITVSSDLGVA